MQLATRVHRSLRVARTAAALWLLYKPPEYARRLLRRPQPDRTPTHERAARLLLRSALDHCLDGRELNVRAVARAVANMERSG